MNFEKAIVNINRSLNKKRPEKFNPKWIKNRCKISHHFIVNNIKTLLGDPDWDLVVSELENYNQKLWMRKMKKREIKEYEDKEELDVVLKFYKNKLYTFVGQVDEKDRLICDWISIRLVRLSQKGNNLAKREIILLLECLTNQWIEYNKSLFVWKGYNELLIEQIEACIRRFRYAGSFLGYLHRTLQYSGLGLLPLEKFSLDDYNQTTEKRKIETFIF